MKPAALDSEQRCVSGPRTGVSRSEVAFTMFAATPDMNTTLDPQTGRIRDELADEGEKTYSMFNHLIGLLSLADVAIPLAALIGTVIMWRVKKDQSAFLDDHGREATNFQLSMVLYVLIGVAFGVLTIGIGFILAAPALIALMILKLVGSIRGALAANRGEFYRYPMCIRFLKAPGEA